MSAYELCSCLAKPIGNFIDVRRLSDTDYASQALLLEYFDRFLAERKFSEPRLTREIVEQYAGTLSSLALRTQSNRLCVVRQFGEYLTRADPLSYVPEPLRSLSSKDAHVPYIYSPQEIQALLATAAALPPPDSLRPCTYRTLLGLLYSTGIRIGEALALNLEHFHEPEQRLYIAEGKFRKSRWIVLSASTNRAVQEYIGRRREKTPRFDDSPLFLNERRQRLCHPTVNMTFKRLLKGARIARDTHPVPRLHDLRHTFAVHRLLAWYRDGQDVNVRLPALATYMGHVDIHSTRIYLRPTAELFEEVSQRFRTHYLNHIAPSGGVE